jgi:hypothetical protein
MILGGNDVHGRFNGGRVHAGGRMQGVTKMFPVRLFRSCAKFCFTGYTVVIGGFMFLFSSFVIVTVCKAGQSPRAVSFIGLLWLNFAFPLVWNWFGVDKIGMNPIWNPAVDFVCPDFLPPHSKRDESVGCTQVSALRNPPGPMKQPRATTAIQRSVKYALRLCH